jgi:hypothetical protein
MKNLKSFSEFLINEDMNQNIINVNGNNYLIEYDIVPKEGDLVLLPDKTLGILGGVRENGLTFTDGLDGNTFNSRLHISKYLKIVKL